MYKYIIFSRHIDVLSSCYSCIMFSMEKQKCYDPLIEEVNSTVLQNEKKLRLT